MDVTLAFDADRNPRRTVGGQEPARIGGDRRIEPTRPNRRGSADSRRRHLLSPVKKLAPLRMTIPLSPTSASSPAPPSSSSLSSWISAGLSQRKTYAERSRAQGRACGVRFPPEAQRVRPDPGRRGRHARARRTGLPVRRRCCGRRSDRRCRHHRTTGRRPGRRWRCRRRRCRR